MKFDEFWLFSFIPSTHILKIPKDLRSLVYSDMLFFENTNIAQGGQSNPLPLGVPLGA